MNILFVLFFTAFGNAKTNRNDNSSRFVSTSTYKINKYKSVTLHHLEPYSSLILNHDAVIIKIGLNATLGLLCHCKI